MDSESGYLCVPERLLNEASDEGEASNVVGGGGLLRPQDPQHLLVDLLLHLLVQSQHVDRPGQGERCLEREPEQEGHFKRDTELNIEQMISIWQRPIHPVSSQSAVSLSPVWVY